MTNLIKATLLRRISDLERWIQWVEDGLWNDNPSIGTGADLLTHLRRELATEQGNLRRVRWQIQMIREAASAGGGYDCELETGQPWPSGEGV